MATEIERETTEYLYVGVTGDLPTAAQELAFMVQPNRPISTDWETAILVDNDQHALWPDALAAVGVATYYLAILIGDFGGNPLTLTAGDYQVWVRLTGAVERPVRVAPTALTVK